MEKETKTKARIAIALTLMAMMVCVAYAATPTGPQLNYVSNSTSSSAGTGTLRDVDDGGYITTVRLNVTQQNAGWKAYVGNVTGKLTLDDASNNTIYDWTLSTISANVYITRFSSIDWPSITCAANSTKSAEDTSLGKSSTSDDNINNTFIGQTHKSLTVAGINIGASTCPAIATYVNDAAQTNGESNFFQEVLLEDSANKLVYTTVAENDQTGFDTNPYDFQAIVADNSTTAITPYYFYVELLS